MRWNYGCPLKPGSSRVLSQKEGKDFVFYSLDPVRGKGEQLGQMDFDPNKFANWSISPRWFTLGSGWRRGQVQRANRVADPFRR